MTKKKTVAKKTSPKKKGQSKVAAKATKGRTAPKVLKKAVKSKLVAPKQNPWLGQNLPNLKVQLVQAGRDLREVALRELVGRGLCVLYFYPKDDTPGCTTEACEFGDRLQDFAALGATVIGASPDPEASHRKFIAKFNLPFALISDPQKELVTKMKLWKEKSFMGKTYMGVERATFLLKDGFVVHAWQPVSVAGHVADVGERIAALKG